MNNLLRFRQQYPIAKNEAVIITSDVNRAYLSGFRSSAGVLAVFADCAALILDFRYLEMAQNKKSLGQIPEDISILPNRRGEKATLQALFEEKEIVRYKIENFALTCHEAEMLKCRYPLLEQSYLSDAVETLRQIKSETELKKIRAAQQITDAAFTYILSILSPKMTERDVALELEFFMKKQGAEALAFETIAVSGKNSSLPHGKPQDVRLTRNGFLTMDFGAQLDGYSSDMTRTVVIGKASDEMKRIYHTVLSAQEEAFAVIKSGVLGYDVDAAARKVIDGAGYKGCFGHGLGHSLGMEVHEAPSFSPSDKTPIPSGAVLSVEPGIYLEGIGGVRIEDIVCVTDDGFVNLTKSPKNLIEI